MKMRLSREARRRFLMLAAALVSATTVTGIATAAEPYPLRTTPTVEYPLPRNVDEQVIVQIEGPRRIWGVRAAARLWDELGDGLTVHLRGTCAERPQAHCVRVRKMSMPGQAAGQSEHYWAGDPDRMVIWLNTAWRLDRDERRYVAAHEFTHILGFTHHTQTRGWMSVLGWFDGPSDAEVAEFLRHYSATSP